MNKHRLYLYMYKITKFYITNGKNSSKKERIVRELEKPFVRLRMKLLVITGISTYLICMRLKSLARH